MQFGWEKEELDYREIRGDLRRNSPLVPIRLGCARVTTNPEPPCRGSEGLRVVQTYVSTAITGILFLCNTPSPPGARGSFRRGKGRAEPHTDSKTVCSESHTSLPLTCSLPNKPRDQGWRHCGGRDSISARTVLLEGTENDFTAI